MHANQLKHQCFPFLEVFHHFSIFTQDMNLLVDKHYKWGSRGMGWWGGVWNVGCAPRCNGYT